MENISTEKTLHSERLILRHLKPGDASEIARLRSDERVNKYLDRPITTSLDDAAAFIKKIEATVEKKEGYYWAIVLNGDDKLLGTICLWNIDEKNKSVELGYELHPDNQGKGLMQEAIALVIDLTFNSLGFTMITAYPKADNSPSVKVLEKSGFARDKNLETEFYKQEGFSELIIYSLSHP